ncbi:hypothetical protein BKA67DRAFT_519170 [Truncatella angustata]|uniref:Prefoldin subunit n=1 Tax=Truncatella angustata TaxID=152316 RepID=A0A9P8UJ57_9PEZI|nr:uncharacterized protein BKA67DRAFT_519170 [Truncatella angustata]KAH6653185.1 hypothetical protein BKA67DRAFT_519170 [Truncatella angustata]KAH8193508.1 hypothetical protein TruAng_012326 [Truncatella angustata]
MNAKPLITPRNAGSLWGTNANLAQVLSSLTSTRRHRYPNLKLKPSRMLALRLEHKSQEPSRRYAPLFRAMAKMNNERLPLMTFQKLLRQQDLSNEKKLGDIVAKTNPALWRDRLSSLERRGWKEADIDHWVWILSAEDGDACVSRLVSSDRPKPLFVLMVILSSGRPFRSPDSLKHVLDYITKNYLAPHEAAAQDQRLGAAPPIDYRQRLSLAKFLIILRRLTARVVNYWPRSITALAEMTRIYIASLPLIEKDGNIYHKRCKIFNTALVQFSRPASFEPVRHMEFNWRAQRILLSMSDTMERPLVIDKLSYRAIRKVLVAQKKSAAERAVAVRYAKTWPPYRQDFDGHDAKRTPEDDQSRSVRAGVLATEAGYPQDDYGKALGVLGGQGADQSPTIQTRSLAPTEWTDEKSQENFFTIWAMKVRATRNAQEAWKAFNSYTNVAPTLQVYTEMFLKLHAAETEVAHDVVPGDSREVFPTHHGNFSEYELARLTPPTTTDLYQHMLSRGVKPHGMCLQHLVSNARSIAEGQQYLRDSTINASAIAHMVSAAGLLHTVLRRVPLLVFKSYVQLLCRLHPDRRGREKISHSELTRLHQAINLARARLAPGTTEAATFRPAWQIICRALARPNIALTNKERIANDIEALDLFLQVESVIGKSIGFDPEIFLYLCRTVQKLIVTQLSRVDLDSKHSSSQLPAYLMQGKSRTGTLLRNAHTTIRHMFKKLVSPASQSQPSLELPQFLNPVTPAHLHGYMRTLAFLEDVQEMVAVLNWVFDNKDMIDEEIERKGEGGRLMMAKMLCAFEAFAGPCLEVDIREEIDAKMERVTEMDDTWHWPSPEDVEVYVQADRRGGSQKLQERTIMLREQQSVR